MLAPWKNSYDQPRQHIKNQRHYFANKGLSSQSYGFSSSHLWMWELDYKERWVVKNWCFRTVLLEKTLESLLDCNEIEPVDPKGNQSWIFIGRTDAEAETPILGHLMWRTNLFEKTLLLGKIEGGRGRRQQRMRYLDGITNLMEMSLRKLQSWWWTGKSGILQSMGSQRVRHYWETELNWISQGNEWEGYSSYFGEGVDIFRNLATVHFLTCMVGFGAVMGPVGVSFSSLVCSTELLLWLKV